MKKSIRTLPLGLHALLSSLFPEGKILAATPLSVDSEVSDDTYKAAGYGKPIRIELQDSNGQIQFLTFHTAAPNDFGHDRRSDRAQEVLLAYDMFNQIPKHVEAIDVGVINQDDTLTSLQNTGEFYLITRYVPGEVYANDLRRISKEGHIRPVDLERCTTLARYLAGLHSRLEGRSALYVRAIRDLIGHGEGIFGIIDGFPDNVAFASSKRLQRIEKQCVEWRWLLRGREERLSQTHGDFHPFNIVFTQKGELALLDASRGGMGEPADDVSCLAINYLFFALEQVNSWKDGFGVLWHRFWDTYLESSGDWDIFNMVPPFLAWRGLVLANPRWYPALSPANRDILLTFIESILQEKTFSPGTAEEVFS